MRIATYNVNGVNGRLPVLLRWLEETQPDVACLQELKAPEDKFPIRAIEQAGYGAIWHGQARWNGVAILTRGQQPIETMRGLPGDPDDTHSRYIEAAVGGLIVANLYLPNGNPRPGPRFDYKMRWIERLMAHADTLMAAGLPRCWRATSTSSRPSATSTCPSAGWTMPCSRPRRARLMR